MPLVAVKVKEGQAFTVYFLEENSDCPSKTFLAELIGSDKGRILRYIEKTAEHGLITNPELSGTIEGTGIRYWRTPRGHGSRMFYFTQPGCVVICTHGIIKKKDKMPPGEIDRVKIWRVKYLNAINDGTIQYREENLDEMEL